jgi:PAS domain S-box-containing protein
MNIRLSILLLLLSLIRCTVMPLQASENLESVTIQFKWFHRFQFAGYYAAVEKGFYAEEGLDVVLREKNPDSDHIDDVLNDTAQYGVADAGLLITRLQGKPVVMLSQIFQHSPLVFLSLQQSNIRDSFDLLNKSIMIDDALHKYPALSALIFKSLGGFDKIKLIPETYRNEDLLRGKTDAMVAYVTDQPFWFKEKGAKINIIDPRDHGIDLYGDNLFTTEREINQHPQRVSKIIRATLKGWKYALENKAEIIEIILKKYNPQDISRAHLVYEAQEIEKMILPRFFKLGHFEKSRYQKTLEIYTQLGLTNRINLDAGFFYQEDRFQTGLPPNSTAQVSAAETIRKDQKHKLVMFIPRQKPFWLTNARYAKAAAANLGMELEVVDFRDDSALLLSEVERVSRKGVSGIIFSAFQSTGEALLQITEKYRTPTFIINTEISTVDFSPRTKYKYWLGKMTPDDVKTGTTLIQQLLSIAKTSGISKYHVLAIEGVPNQEASIQRRKGMESYAKYTSEIESLTIVPGNWKRETASTLFKKYYKKNPDINVVWCANDIMALAVADTVKALGINKPIYIGGMNWDPPALEAIGENRLHASLGGHFIEGGWAVLLLHDYLKGEDFATESLSFTTTMPTITESNLPAFLFFLNLDPYQVDFKNFSKIHNTGLLKYDMDLARMAEDVFRKQTLSGTSIELTDKERTWLTTHQVIRVSSEPDYAPFDFIEDGKPVGFSIDYLNIVAKRAGLRLEFVQDNWNNLVKMGKEKKIDLVHTIFYTPDRAPYFLFTEPYKKVVNAIYVKEGLTGIKSIQNLAGLQVVLPKGDSIAELLPKMVPNGKYEFVDTYESILKSISLGQKDATVLDTAVANYLIRKLTITNVIPAAEADIAVGDRDPQYRLAVRNDWPELHSILQKTMASINRDEITRLETRWFGLVTQTGSSKLALTSSERAWLKAHPVVHAVAEEVPPYAFLEHGNPFGHTIELLKLMGDIVGLELNFEFNSAAANIAKIKTDEAQLTINKIYTAERATYLLFGKQPFQVKQAIFAKKGRTDIQNLESLKGKSYAGMKGYSVNKMIEKKYPDTKIITSENMFESLRLVSDKKADVAIIEANMGQYLLRKYNISDVHIVGFADFFGTKGIQGSYWAAGKKHPQLKSILDKAYDKLNSDTRQQLWDKWFQFESGEPTPNTKLTQAETPSEEISFWRLLIYGLAVFLAISLLTWILIRLLKKENITIAFGSTWFRLLVLAGLSVFLVIVFAIGWFNLEKNQQTHMEDVKRTLSGTLSIFQDRLDLWLVERKSYMKQLGRNPELVSLTKRLLRVAPEKNMLLASAELQGMRSFFRDSKDIFANIGFFVINPDHISIGSRRNTNVGTLNLISKEHPELLRRALQGKVGFVPPMTSDVHLSNSTGSKGNKKPPTMFFIGPIQDENGKVLAVFTLRVDPWRDFSKAIQSFDFLQSSEIYAFDKKGCLLTPSRFDQQLRRIGLLVEDQGSALNIEIRDPGVNLVEGDRATLERSQQPFTHLVQRALVLKQTATLSGIKRGSSAIESNMTGYRDYRGVPVFGVWLWDFNLNIGLAAEINEDEALSHYYQTRFMIVGTLGFTLFLSVGAILLVLIIGERASKSLMKSRDTLEEKVEERTAELEAAEERSRLLLDSAGEGIFGVDTNGKINFINPKTLDLLGYTEEEMIGVEAHQLIHHSHADGTHYDSIECPMYLSFTHGKEYKVTDEVLWRKNGSYFHVEYSSTPIQKEGKILGAVVTFLDVSERKKVEMEMAIAKENLDLALKSANMGTWKYHVPENRLEADVNTRKLYGLGQVELDGSMEQWFTFVHPDDMASIGEIMQHTIANQIIDYKKSFRIIMPGKQVRHILSVGKFSYDKNGDAISASGLVWNITDIKVMEEALTAEKSHLQKVLDTSPVGVGISVDGIMRFANPRILDMLDMKIDDPSPKVYVNAKDRDHITNTLAKDGIIKDYELRMYGKNREIRDMLVTYMNVSYGSKEAILVWVMDITELKKTDRELRAKFDELSRFRKLAVGREMKMIEIKKGINNLLIQQGKEPIYKIVG